MALTHDDIKEILELRGKHYSYRKIYDKTERNEKTIRKVIEQAEKRVISLKDEGLVANQIARQLDYPVVFVSDVLDKIGKPKLETMVEAETEEPSIKLDFKAGWEEYKRTHAIGIAKEGFCERVIELIKDLNETENQLESEKIAGIGWRKRKKTIVKELEDFVLPQIAGIQTEKNQSDIEGIIDEIEQKVIPLYEDLQYNIREARELRHRQEKKQSDQLLDQKIDVPLFPQFVRKQIKERFLVRPVQEAAIVADALDQIALLIMEDSRNNPAEAREMWRRFAKIVKVGGWSYLKRMAAQYRENTDRILVSINVCPRCESKLTRKRVEDKEVISCTSCGKAWEILKR